MTRKDFGDILQAEVVMTREEIIAAALALPDDERHALGDALLSDGAFDDRVADAWCREIQRRLDDIDSGRVQMIPTDEAMAWVRLRLAGRRARSQGLTQARARSI